MKKRQKAMTKGDTYSVNERKKNVSMKAAKLFSILKYFITLKVILRV